MSDSLFDTIKESVLQYFTNHSPCDYDDLLKYVIGDTGLSILREELKAVVVPMIASGKLKYHKELTIGLP